MGIDFSAPHIGHLKRAAHSGNVLVFLKQWGSSFRQSARLTLKSMLMVIE
jgi:hypothetical protein